jgi:hypothetical protein
MDRVKTPRENAAHEEGPTTPAMMKKSAALDGPSQKYDILLAESR